MNRWKSWMKRAISVTAAACMAVSGLAAGPVAAQPAVMSAAADAAVDASIAVQKVEGLSQDFIHGVDVSMYLSEVQSGVKFYDEAGNEKNLFDIFKEAGVNWVRLRVWNCPFAVETDADGNYVYDANGNLKYLYVDEAGKEYKADDVKETKQNDAGYAEYFLADGTQVYRQGYGAGNCDIDTVTAIGKIATEHGLRVLVDFHYSDFWADPNKQRAPKAWEKMNVEQKAAALEKYTADCMNQLKTAGVDVGMVQIGNEINNGMAGEKETADICTLLKAGSKAIRAVDPNIMVAVHYTDPQNEGFQLGKAAALAEAGVDYDVFATSAYSFWHGTPETLTANLKEIADTYNKKVMVAEVSYPWTFEDGDGYGNGVSEDTESVEYLYPIDAEGQANAVRDAIAAVAAVGEKGIGTFYWEPAWIPVNVVDKDAANAETALAANQKAWNLYGSGWGTKYVVGYDPEVTEEFNGGNWDNQAFFDFSGKALPSINVYKWVYTGTNAPVRVSRVSCADVTKGFGEPAAMPKQAQVKLNNGTVLQVDVNWDKTQVDALEQADFGEYKVSGSLAAFTYENMGQTVSVEAGTWKVESQVTITSKNYVVNGGFEDNDGDGTGWTLTNHLADDAGWPKIDKGSSNAHDGLYYYTGWSSEAMDFSVEQTLAEKPENGLYELFAYFQGTGVEKISEEGTLYAIVTYKDGTKKNYSTPIQINNVWKDWYRAVVKDIEISDQVTKVQVGTRIACSGASAWTVADDISLMRYADLPEKKETKVANKVYNATKNADGTFSNKKGKVITNAIAKLSNGDKYIVDAEGKKLKSQIVTTTDGTKYYVGKAGKVAVSKIVKVDGKKYYAQKNGAFAVKKWVKVGKKQYYCNASGRITKTKK